MAIPKVMGIETEFGISGPGMGEFNPVLSSSLLINSYAGTLRRIRWDYEQESPLRDARGYEPVQERQPVEEDLGLANVILPNGARYYVDHAHPEYSTPECASPRGLVVHDKAGERILERSLQSVRELLPPGQRLAIYKNNTDGKSTTSCPSAPTSSRRRSGWRPPSSGPSSTPATSPTPTPRSTAGCTSSWATPTCASCPRT
jgi:hypothetical protein